MYLARRTADQNVAEPAVAAAAAFEAPARRAARTRRELLRTRVAPAVVSVALLATSGAFALNLGAAEDVTAATPAAPVREADAISRDAARSLADAGAIESDPATTEEAPAEPVATEEAPAEVVATEGADAFVAGTWAAAFGAPAGTKYAHGNLAVRAQASDGSAELGSVKEGDKVSVLDKVTGAYRQISFNGKVGYVLDARLGNKAPVKEAPKPVAPAKEATSTKAAPGKSAPAKSAPAEKVGSTPAPGKSVLGLKPRAMVVYNAVTARWSFTSIGGYRASNNRSNHGLGGAIDFMTFKDSAKGWAVANFLAANAAEFNIDHIIFEQKIWTPYNPTWRGMANRGSATANHMDHVHVSVKL